MNKPTLLTRTPTTWLTAALATFALVAGLGAAVVAPAHAAAGTTKVKPAALDRGKTGRVPHVDLDTLVVADQRHRFKGHELVFLGYTGKGLGDYVVGAYKNGKPRSHKVVVVTPEGQRRRVLSRVSVPEIMLSSDGEQLYRPAYDNRLDATTIRVWSIDDGSLVRQRRFDGYLHVLDAFEGRAVITGHSPARTLWWNTKRRTTSAIVSRESYHADIRADRLAGLDGNPYDGGCSIVSTLQEPRTRLWRSCKQAVTSFSPSGDRVLTTYLLADGLGPGELQLRTVGGKRIHTYRSYYFARYTWEADEVVLLQAHGKKRNAWVRCDDTGACERTGKLRRGRP